MLEMESSNNCCSFVNGDHDGDVTKVYDDDDDDDDDEDDDDDDADEEDVDHNRVPFLQICFC